MPYQSSSAASDVSLAAFGLRIIRAIQSSAARGKTAACVANRLAGVSAGAPLLRLTVRRRLVCLVNAIVPLSALSSSDWVPERAGQSV